MDLPLFQQRQQEQQDAVVKDRRRFVAAATGRRWGKSTVLARRLWTAAIEKPGTYIYISPSPSMVRLFLECCSELFDNRRTHRRYSAFYFDNGSTIYCLTQEDILNGAIKDHNVKGIAVDEFFFQKKQVKTEKCPKGVFWPMLMAENEFVLMVGTPPPRRAVKRLRLVLQIAAKRAGLDLLDVGVHVYGSPMSQNAIEECRSIMSESAFDSELLLQYA